MNILRVLIIGVCAALLGAGCATAPAPETPSETERLTARRWQSVRPDDFSEPMSTPYDYDIKLKKAYRAGFWRGIAEGVAHRGAAELTPEIYASIEDLPVENQTAFVSGWYRAVEMTSEKATEIKSAIVDERLAARKEEPGAEARAAMQDEIKRQAEEPSRRMEEEQARIEEERARIETERKADERARRAREREEKERRKAEEKARRRAEQKEPSRPAQTETRPADRGVYETDPFAPMGM